MRTIVLATQKGGSGKSTLATGLAVAALVAGHQVRIIETDPQGTLSSWQKRRQAGEPLVEAVYNAQDIEPKLRAFEASGVTVTIIDTAGGITAATTAAIRHCDICMIPARPSIPDIEATAQTLSVVKAWKRPFAYILNQTPLRGQRIDNAAATLSGDAGFELFDVVAQPFIVMRNDHQDALAAGLAVCEFDPAGRSAEEIGNLWAWIENRLNIAPAAGAEAIEEIPEVEFPIMLRPQPAEIVPHPASRPIWAAVKAFWRAHA